MSNEKTVWVLTYSVNDYNQHGEYFFAAFAKKPTLPELAECMSMTGEGGHNVMAAVAYLERLLKGGGRQGAEDRWYSLTEVPFGKPAEI